MDFESIRKILSLFKLRSISIDSKLIYFIHFIVPTFVTKVTEYWCSGEVFIFREISTF